jgi:hypothetical protein
VGRDYYTMTWQYLLSFLFFVSSRITLFLSLKVKSKIIKAVDFYAEAVEWDDGRIFRIF